MKIGGKMEVIGIISAHYLPHLGGVERYTYNLAKGLLKEEKTLLPLLRICHGKKKWRE